MAAARPAPLGGWRDSGGADFSRCGSTHIEGVIVEGRPHKWRPRGTQSCRARCDCASRRNAVLALVVSQSALCGRVVLADALGLGRPDSAGPSRPDRERQAADRCRSKGSGGVMMLFVWSSSEFWTCGGRGGMAETRVKPGGPGGTRTPDARVKSPALCLLSYRPSLYPMNSIEGPMGPQAQSCRVFRPPNHGRPQR